MWFVATAGALAALLQGQAYEGELKERLRAEPKAILQSAKPSYDLELCVADALTVVGNPSVFRDGPDNIVIAVTPGGGNAFIATVSIIKVPTGSKLELRVRGKGLDDRLASRVGGCT